MQAGLHLNLCTSEEASSELLQNWGRLLDERWKHHRETKTVLPPSNKLLQIKGPGRQRTNTDVTHRFSKTVRRFFFSAGQLDNHVFDCPACSPDWFFYFKCMHHAAQYSKNNGPKIKIILNIKTECDPEMNVTITLSKNTESLLTFSKKMHYQIAIF